MKDTTEKLHLEEIHRLAEEFQGCRKLLLALGDENRQHLILEMLRMGECGGLIFPGPPSPIIYRYSRNPDC